MLVFLRRKCYFCTARSLLGEKGEGFVKTDRLMKNKKWNLLLAAAALCALASCGNAAKKQTNGEMKMENQCEKVTTGGRQTLQVGDVKVTWIKDNVGDKLMGRELFADAPDSLLESLSLQEGIPSTVSVFWVETDGVGILFDTGLGSPESGLLAGLDSLGVKPADVRYLYLTHFHGDHIGGMIRDGKAVFPNAQVYVSKAEYDAWMQMPDGQKAQVVKTMEAYKDRLHLFDFDDVLPGNVVALNGVGHTPGHTVYKAGKLLVVGDLVHGAALQLPHPEYCASYDMDKEAAVKVRRHFLQMASADGLTMAGMHFPAPAFK